MSDMFKKLKAMWTIAAEYDLVSYYMIDANMVYVTVHDVAAMSLVKTHKSIFIKKEEITNVTNKGAR